MRVVRRRPAAVLAATVLALSACGGDGEGGSSSSSTTASPQPVEPSSSSSSSSSGSASSSSSASSSGASDAPDLPEAATKHTQDGAVAFAKYYLMEQSRALHAGDVSTLKRLYSPDCSVCQTYVEQVEGRIKDGLHADIVATSIRGASVTNETDGKSDEAVTLKATNASYRLVDDSGESIGKTKGLDYRNIIYVDWKGGEWTVVDSYMIT